MSETDENEPMTDSIKRRGRKVDERGIVEGKGWNAIVAGACELLAIAVLLIVWLKWGG